MALKPGQIACINTLDAPVAVSAGAGSGKTFTLTRRIIHALSSGVAQSIDDVLAITFTTKAAGEIKSRVKDALVANGMVDEALRVDGAWISTIHGMCSRILREHALELGIDPAFAVLDELDAAYLKDAAIEEALSSENDMVSPAGLDELFFEYQARAAGVGASSVEDMLRTLVEAASSSPAGLDAFVRGPLPEPGVRILSRALTCARTVAELVELEKPSKSRDAYLESLTGGIEACDAAFASGKDIGPKDAMRILAGLPYPAGNFGSKTGAYKAYLEEARAEFGSAMMEARLAFGSNLLDDLIELARRVLSSYARMKQERGALDNNDLLVLAARALDEHPKIAECYAGRFTVVMVDEFQDTDQVQIDMIKRIAGEGWQRLCTVGDAQQSIYRFRGADVSVFRRHLEAVREANPSGLITLPDNFRSHTDVLAFVDRVFERPRAFGRAFMSLSPSRDETRVKVPFLSDGPRVCVKLVSYPKGGSAAARSAEAGLIADEFARLRACGHSAGDMVILLGTVRHVDVYADALRERGLSCVVAKGSVFNRASEVRVVVRLAEALVNPKATAALFEVLSSDLFALSADDLLRMSTYFDEDRGFSRRRSLDRGFFSLAREEEELSGSLAACERVLMRALRRVGRERLSKTMRRVVVDAGWLSRLESAGAEGQAVAANVLKALRMVEDIEASGAIGPATVAARFAAKVAISTETPGSLATSGGDFVRLMTVHASKGLEFPIVAVAEMGDRAHRSDKLVCHQIQGCYYVSLDVGRSGDEISSSSTFAKAASGFSFEDEDEDDLARAVIDADSAAIRRAAAIAHDAEGEAQERKRLLYVALTRAKEALIVSMKGQVTKGDPSGVSSGVYGDIQEALVGEGAFFEPGTTMFDFGGTRPASFTRYDLVALPDGDWGLSTAEQASKAPSAAEEGDGESAECARTGESADALVDAADSSDAPTAQPSTRAIFEPAWAKETFDEPYAFSRNGVFSYTAISDAAFDAPDGFGESAGDSASETSVVALGATSPDAPYSAPDAREDFGAGATEEAACAPAFSFDDEDDAAWAAIRASLGDADKATDFGTAFHRAAQLAVLLRGDEGPLAAPPEDRVAAVARASGVSGGGRRRLDAALSRWLASSVAHDVATWDTVRAEVPFFVSVEAPGAPLYMEGALDLLATNADRTCALVVDYKTGGHPDETSEELFSKHLLQASCYAYALMTRGYTSVQAVFVRVEQEDLSSIADALDPTAPGEPQCVRYAFAAQDFEAAREMIVEAYRATRG